MRKTIFAPRRRRTLDFRMRNPTERPPKHLKVCDVFWRILVAKIRLSWFVRFDTRTPHFRQLVPRPNGSAAGGAVQAWPERAAPAPALGVEGITGGEHQRPGSPL